MPEQHDDIDLIYLDRRVVKITRETADRLDAWRR